VSRAQDEIQYFDRASNAIVAVQALIEQENINGLRFRVGARGEPVDVPATDLIDVVYSVPGSLRLILARARNEEKKSVALGATQPERVQAIAQAIKEYQGLLKEGEQTGSPSARRHWQFRIARLRAQAASENRAETKAALTELTAFVRQNDSWQTVVAASLLTRLLANGGDFDAAAQAHRQLSNGKGLSPAAKREQAREVILLDLLGKNLKPASAAIDAQRVETPATGSEPMRLRALEALRDAADGKPERALSQLEGLENQVKEPADRGFLWLLRGYCESIAGRDDQALWAFLRVDQLYSEDQAVHAKAVEQLVKLFEARSDWAKAALYRTKLWRDFAG
jgi:hypothetical protein